MFGATASKVREFEVQQIPDALDADVGWRVRRPHLGIPSIVSLPHKYGRHSGAPDLLDSRKNAKLIVYDDIMTRWISGFHVGQLAFLVHVDQGVAFDRFIESGAVHFSRLKDDVAVSKQDGGSPLPDERDDVKRVGEKAVGKGIVYEEARNGQ